MKFGSSVVGLVGVFALFSCSGGQPNKLSSSNVNVVVQALELSGVADACYTISAASRDNSETWSVEACASEYGADGSISYIGPCDATSNPNTVSVTLDRLVDSTGKAITDFENPCPPSAPCSKNVECVENADTQVEFDLTVLRDANQGFFDIAVSFDDIFCSAKFDCAEPDGGPIELLYGPDGERAPTAVMGLACTAGPGQKTHLYMSDVEIVCDSRSAPTVISIDPTQGPGNFYGENSPAPAGLLQVASYPTVSTVALNGELMEKASMTMAIAPDLSWPPSKERRRCSLRAQATATEDAAPASAAGALIAPNYPVIAFNVPLLQSEPGGPMAFACSSHPLNGADGRVSVVSAPEGGLVLEHEVASTGAAE